MAAEIKVEQAVRKIDMPEPEAIDLLEHAGSPVLKRAVPVLGVAVVVFVLWRVLPSPEVTDPAAERARVAELLGRPPDGRVRGRGARTVG